MSIDGVMMVANLEECIFEEFDAVDVLAKIGESSGSHEEFSVLLLRLCKYRDYGQERSVLDEKPLNQ